jgi:hypothetical protein
MRLRRMFESNDEGETLQIFCIRHRVYLESVRARGIMRHSITAVHENTPESIDQHDTFVVSGTWVGNFVVSKLFMGFMQERLSLMNGQ